MVYLELIHGRKDPNQKLDDWGEDGPILGPFNWIHTTYANHIRGFPVTEGDSIDFHLVGDMLHYDGVFYGDWSVISEPVDEEGKKRIQQMTREKAQLSTEILKNFGFETSPFPVQQAAEAGLLAANGTLKKPEIKIPDSVWIVEHQHRHGNDNFPYTSKKAALFGEFALAVATITNECGHDVKKEFLRLMKEEKYPEAMGLLTEQTGEYFIVCDVQKVDDIDTSLKAYQENLEILSKDVEEAEKANAREDDTEPVGD